MRIRHQVEAPELEDVKTRVRDHRLTPIVVTALVTVLAVRLTTKQPQIIIVNNGTR